MESLKSRAVDRLACRRRLMLPPHALPSCSSCFSRSSIWKMRLGRVRPSRRSLASLARDAAVSFSPGSPAWFILPRKSYTWGVSVPTTRSTSFRNRSEGMAWVVLLGAMQRRDASASALKARVAPLRKDSAGAPALSTPARSLKRASVLTTASRRRYTPSSTCGRAVRMAAARGPPPSSPRAAMVPRTHSTSSSAPSAWESTAATAACRVRTLITGYLSEASTTSE
mmetsp:Transcript_49871/g.159469  ORF Transcript_49871/g.159469 Transcript_49871/m.159469 type:complete len:226 (-) Transcript_49871:374-1051(-)